MLDRRKLLTGAAILGAATVLPASIAIATVKPKLGPFTYRGKKMFVESWPSGLQFSTTYSTLQRMEAVPDPTLAEKRAIIKWISDGTD